MTLLEQVAQVDRIEEPRKRGVSPVEVLAGLMILTKISYLPTVHGELAGAGVSNLSRLFSKKRFANKVRKICSQQGRQEEALSLLMRQLKPDDLVRLTRWQERVLRVISAQLELSRVLLDFVRVTDFAGWMSISSEENTDRLDGDISNLSG